MTRRERICLLAAAVLLAATGLASLLRRAPETRVKPDHIRGILELAPLADTSKALVIGYHYHLLQRFAAANGQTVDITGLNGDRYYEISSTTSKYTVKDITAEFSAIDVVTALYFDKMNIDPADPKKKDRDR